MQGIFCVYIYIFAGVTHEYKRIGTQTIKCTR